MKKKKFFFWVSDLYTNSGEGRLAYNLLREFVSKNINFEIKTPLFTINNKKKFEKIIKKNNLYKSNLSFSFRYLFFIVGLYHLWVNFFKGNKVFYVNYLPLWNFVIFMLSPPNTIFGPITGTLYFNEKKKNIELFFRKYLFKLFFSISIFFLELRGQWYVFSTSLLKNLFNKKFISKSLFDLQLAFKLKRNNLKKYYDLIIYNRFHSNKNNQNFKKIFSDIKFKKYRIISVGEKIYLPNITNIGFVHRNKLINYLKKSRVSIISSENIYSFFCQDCIANNVIPIFDKNISFDSNIIKINKNNLIDYNNDLKFKNQLLNILKKRRKVRKIYFNKKYLKKIKVEFEKFISNLV